MNASYTPNKSSDHLPPAVRPSTGPWTEEAVALLTKLWTDGLSCSQIAKALAKHGSFSRNAVIGKVSRLGLGGRLTPSKPRKFKPAPPAARKAFGFSARPAPAIPYIPAPEPLEPTVAGVLQLQAHQCRWPMEGAPGGSFAFCGRGTVEGKPYCEAHAEKARGAVPRKARDHVAKQVKGGAWRG